MSNGGAAQATDHATPRATARLRALARFLWDFVVGDDWRIALAVLVALTVTAVVGADGWFVLPLVVGTILGYSVVSPPGRGSAAPSRRGGSRSSGRRR